MKANRNIGIGRIKKALTAAQRIHGAHGGRRKNKKALTAAQRIHGAHGGRRKNKDSRRYSQGPKVGYGNE